MFVKIVNFDGNKRKFKAKETISFENVKDMVQRVSGSAEKADECLIKYVDSDNELITLSCQDDFEVCLEEISMMQEDRKLKTLTLRLVKVNDVFGCDMGDIPVSRSESFVFDPLNRKNDQGMSGQSSFITYKSNMATPFDRTGQEINFSLKEKKEEKSFAESKQLNELDISGINPPTAVGDPMKESSSKPIFKFDDSELVQSSLDQSISRSKRSTISAQMRKDMARMINEKVQKEVNKAIKSAQAHNSPTFPEGHEPKAVHEGVRCTGCGMNPIIGIRFNSLEHDNYDLCENCVKEMHLDHPMVMLRKPITDSLTERFGKRGGKPAHNGTHSPGKLSKFTRKEVERVAPGIQRQHQNPEKEEISVNPEPRSEVKDNKTLKRVKYHQNPSKSPPRAEGSKQRENPQTEALKRELALKYGRKLEAIGNDYLDKVFNIPPFGSALGPLANLMKKRFKETSRREIDNYLKISNPREEKSVIHPESLSSGPDLAARKKISTLNQKYYNSKRLTPERRVKPLTKPRTINPHPRLYEFARVFKLVPRNDLNRFLHKHAGRVSEDQLWNRTLDEFSGYMR